MSPAEHTRAFATPCQEYQLTAVLQPAFDHPRRVLAGVQQMQVLVADLDQVGQLHQRRDPFTPQVNVRLRIQAYVRIEADQALAAFPAHQCQ
ncbi:hypothetical protein D3C78_1549960 [compost metagenome]